MSYPPAFIDFCNSINHRLTSLRKSILYVLWQSAKPLKAYDILNQLLLIKNNSKPPTVYRVLEHFVQWQIAHKIESIQSYTLCTEPEKKLSSEILMVCNSCHQVMEVYDKEVHQFIKNIAAANNFCLSQAAIELKGLCKNCQT